MQRFHKTCCCFGQNAKRKGSISSSNFDRQLPKILFTCLYFCVSILRVVVVGKFQSARGLITSLFDGPPNSMLGGDYFQTYGWRGALIVYENAKLRMKIKLSNWFPGECDFL